MMLTKRTLCSLSILAATCCCRSAAVIDDAAAIKLTLNKVVSTPGLECREGDNFRFHDAAITLSGTNVTMADVSATWSAEATAFTTSGNEVLKVDATKTPPTLTLMKGDAGSCVYDMEVKAGGGFMGITSSKGTITEAGIWQFGDFDQSKSEGTHCQLLGAKNQAFVAYTTSSGGRSSEKTSVIFASMDGIISDHTTKRTSLTSHFGPPNYVVYLTVSEEGVIYFSTLIDVERNRPVGCVYPIKVVEGSMLGIVPAPGNHRRLRLAA